MFHASSIKVAIKMLFFITLLLINKLLNFNDFVFNVSNNLSNMSSHSSLMNVLLAVLFI